MDAARGGTPSAPCEPTSPAPQVGTVVITTRDRCALVLDTVTRLLELEDDWDVIVVDDASTDRTRETLQAAFGDLVVVHRTDRPMGAAARNLGVRAASTDLVAIGDDASWWTEGSLVTAARAFAADPSLGLVAATAPATMHDPAPGRAAPGAHAPRCGVVVNRRAFLQVGGFSDLLVGGEELLALDLRRAGWSLVDDPLVTCRRAAERLDGDGPAAWRARQRDELLVAWMRRPLADAARQTARVVARSARDREARRVLGDLVRTLPRALASRQPLPRWVERQLARRRR